MQKLKQKNLILRTFKAKIKNFEHPLFILSDICSCMSEFCGKFSVSAGKLQLSAPRTF